MNVGLQKSLSPPPPTHTHTHTHTHMLPLRMPAVSSESLQLLDVSMPYIWHNPVMITRPLLPDCQVRIHVCHLILHCLIRGFIRDQLCSDSRWARSLTDSDSVQSPHRISAGGSLLFMRCVSLTLTGLVSAWRRGEAPSAVLVKPLSDCVTVLCLRQCKSRHLKVCEILKEIHAIFKQMEYLAFLFEVCIVIMWVTPGTRVVVVSFFF